MPVKTKLTLAIAATLLSVSAFAETPKIPLTIHKGAIANANAQAEAASDATASANNEGISQNVTFETRAQAPSISAPSVFPTATCQSGFSIGGSGSNGGGLLGISFTKKQCELFLLAQNYAALGLTVAACETLNKTKAAERAFGADKPGCTIPAPAPASSPPAPASPSVVIIEVPEHATKEDLRRAFEAAVSK